MLPSHWGVRQRHCFGTCTDISSTICFFSTRYTSYPASSSATTVAYLFASRHLTCRASILSRFVIGVASGMFADAGDGVSRDEGSFHLRSSNGERLHAYPVHARPTLAHPKLLARLLCAGVALAAGSTQSSRCRSSASTAGQARTGFFPLSL